jgi:biotin carboxyl carrier protein
MKNLILKWLNGALGQREEFEPIPLEQQEFPEEGIIYAPGALQTNEVSVGGLYLGPECNFLVQAGSEVIGGKPIAEVCTSTHILEVTAPCNAVIEELLVENGQVVEAEQPIVRLRKP